MADHEQHIDELSGTATTGHEWDGLRELNTPLPRWWLWMFYATIVWSIAYWIAMPTWPLIVENSKGMLGYSSRANVVADYGVAQKAREEAGMALQNASLDQIKSDPALLEFAMGQGEAAFGDNCAPCHGTGATGGPGYPNLQDNDWLWGGALDAIEYTVQHGIRSGDDDARIGDMPAFITDGLLEEPQVIQAVNYVRSLSNLEVDSTVDLAAGQTVFIENCASCHGEDAKGLQEMGAPNLTDGIWLYGSSPDAVMTTVSKGRKGVMPAWTGRLNDVTIKSVAVYVHSLGGGQ